MDEERLRNIHLLHFLHLCTLKGFVSLESQQAFASKVAVIKGPSSVNRPYTPLSITKKGVPCHQHIASRVEYRTLLNIVPQERTIDSRLLTFLQGEE